MSDYRNEELYGYGRLSSYIAIFCKMVYFLTSDGVNQWTFIKFIPDLIVSLHELLLQLFDYEFLMESSYQDLYNIYYTNVGANMMLLTSLLIVSLIFWLFDLWDIRSSIDAQFNIDENSTDYSGDSIWNALYADFRSVSVFLKQRGGPVITFRPEDIAFVGAWNVITDVLVVIGATGLANMRLGNAMTIAGANYLYMVPWYALGWIFFDVYRPEDGSIPEDAEELQEDPEPLD